MAESLTKEKQNKDRIPPDGEEPLYGASYIQTWENYRRMNEELYRQKLRQLAASLFAILTVVGTAFMVAENCGFSDGSAMVLPFYFLLRFRLSGDTASARNSGVPILRVITNGSMPSIRMHLR